MKRLYFLLIPLFAVLYSSCTKIQDDGPAPDPLQGLLLTDTLTMYTGNVVKLNVTVTPTSYDTTKLVWKSSDTSVISVTNRGVITAKNEGTSQISLSNVAETKSVSCLVTVKDSLKVGLIAYYPFNNSANDFSGHNYNGTAHDITSVADRFGKPNSAYNFNGISSYITVADKQALRLNSTNFTINYWINLDNYSSSYGTTVFSKRAVGNQQGWITGVGGVLNAGSIVGKSGTITYNVSGGGDPFAYGQLVCGISAWHMLTVVYNYDSSQVALYVDGVFDRISENIPTPNADINTNLYIGADSQGLGNPSSQAYLMKGGLDDMRIYKRVLNAHEIHKLFVATK